MRRLSSLFSFLVILFSFYFAGTIVFQHNLSAQQKTEKKDKKGKSSEKEDTKKKATQSGPAKIDMPKPEEKEVSRDELADKKRDEAIKMLKDIITRFEKGPKKADVMFQLAELYWEKSKYVYFQEMYEYEKKLDD